MADRRRALISRSSTQLARGRRHSGCKVDTVPGRARLLHDHQTPNSYAIAKMCMRQPTPASSQTGPAACLSKESTEGAYRSSLLNRTAFVERALSVPRMQGRTGTAMWQCCPVLIGSRNPVQVDFRERFGTVRRPSRISRLALAWLYARAVLKHAEASPSRPRV